MKHSKKIAALLVLAIGAAVYMWMSRPARVITETDRAVDVVNRFLDSPENLVAPRISGLSRGEKDTPVDFRKDEQQLAPEQVTDSKEFAGAVLRGDVDAAQKVLERYKGKQYGLAQLSVNVSHVFYQAGVPFAVRFSPWGGYLHIVRSDPRNLYGNLGVRFMIGKPPAVTISVHPEGSGENTWSDDETDQVTPDVALKGIGAEAVRSILLRQTDAGR